MKTLLEDYKRKLKKAESMLKNGMYYEDEQKYRISIKARVYKNVIIDIERAMARQQPTENANCAIFDSLNNIINLPYDIDSNDKIVLRIEHSKMQQAIKAIEKATK